MTTKVYRRLCFSDDPQAEVCVSQAEEEYAKCVTSCGTPVDPSCSAGCNREYRNVSKSQVIVSVELTRFLTN